MSDESFKKAPVTVVVGAGASVVLGVPSTPELTQRVKGSMLSYEAWDVLPSEFRPRVERLFEAADAYYGEGAWNFEHLHDLLEGASALFTGWVPGNAPTISEAGLTTLAPHLSGILDQAFVARCSFVLTRTVLEGVTVASANAPGHEQWSAYKAFWQRLSEDFLLTLVTLNYDTLLEQALDLGGAHQGFAPVDGEGVWRLDLARASDFRASHRAFHLHGSIQFGAREYGTDANRFCYDSSHHELYWHPTAAAAQQTLWGHSPPRSQSGRYLEGGRIVTGFNKPDKLLVEPMASYYLEAANQLGRSRRVLIVGYGFADAHVNALLARAIRAHGTSCRVAIIDKIDMMWETGSTRRAEMLVMLQRFGSQRFEFHDRHPYPWRAANGSTCLFWNGLLSAATAMNELVAFLGS